MKRIGPFIALLAPAVFAGCNAEQYEPINVAVYPSTMSCAIEDKPLDCTQLGIYIRDTLKAAPDREITVSFAGTEKTSPDDKSVDRIAEVIRKAGFTNVRVIRFDL